MSEHRQAIWPRHSHSILGCCAFVACLGVLAGCAVKPVQWSPVPAPSPKPAIGQRIADVKAEGRSVLQLPSIIGTNITGIQRTNITLHWDNLNPPEDAKYMLTEFHSTTNLQQPFTFKAYVAAGLTNVTFKITNTAEFFRCRFAQTNITPWLLTEWNR